MNEMIVPAMARTRGRLVMPISDRMAPTNHIAQPSMGTQKRMSPMTANTKPTMATTLGPLRESWG